MATSAGSACHQTDNGICTRGHVHCLLSSTLSPSSGNSTPLFQGLTFILLTLEMGGAIPLRSPAPLS